MRTYSICMKTAQNSNVNIINSHSEQRFGDTITFFYFASPAEAQAFKTWAIQMGARATRRTGNRVYTWAMGQGSES
jgi:hypothetical protein